MPNAGACTTQPTCAPTCPLCGEPNRCAPAAAGSFEVVCWCTTVKIAPGALERIPVESRGKACLCAACAAGTT
ncbi:cysteine-rich CWC family protein [Ideonella paludis]|uniref:Cysteine-rich CWC family protein n=2 Tax=Ideonella paludis TaxID=1233411 RepID=A0ABS5DWF2_9BURK|nr:cysteine-rich CWC family protein [Ideonella paludis]